MGTKFSHTNLIAQDWRRLARFYEQVFGCTPVPPERDLSGQWLEDGTGVPGAEIKGVHLRLPGYGDTGPTLEILQYSRQKEHPETAANLPGFAHVAFAVDDVQATMSAVFAAGGRPVGKLVCADVPGVGNLTFTYVADPEGNIIEVQRWEH